MAQWVEAISIMLAHLSVNGVWRSLTGLFSLNTVARLLMPEMCGVLSESCWLTV
jgi:hypothetical protein